MTWPVPYIAPFGRSLTVSIFQQPYPLLLPRAVSGRIVPSVSLLELVVPFVEVNVENNHGARSQSSHQKSEKMRL